MGTASTKKFYRNVAGVPTEEALLLTSAGAGDANRGVALNVSGFLDASIINSTVTSAGAGSAGMVTALDSGGHLDLTVMPSGIGPDTVTIVASETLSAGAFVNIWNNGGVFKVRNADATTSGKRAHGFVLAGFSSAATATVYFVGNNTAVSGQTPGDVFLTTTPGVAGATAPSGSGNLVQCLGAATSATSINFNNGQPFVLA